MIDHRTRSRCDCGKRENAKIKLIHQSMFGDEPNAGAVVSSDPSKTVTLVKHVQTCSLTHFINLYKLFMTVLHKQKEIIQICF